MRFHTLDEWLVWQTRLHNCAVDLGLERVGEVARRLNLLQPRHAVITVAGTNGKGSTVAMLEAILSAAGYRVGSYTSPHLLHYNERIRLSQQDAGDDHICRAFAAVDEARADISLSYFEFATLAAMQMFEQAAVDVALLEVGLGGRLDAVNLQSADVAIISSIGLDHMEWLGPDRESIGREKAGIMRAQRPVVCGDPDPPRSLLDRAQELDAPMYCLNRQFRFRFRPDAWDFEGPLGGFEGLPLPALFGENQLRNAASVLMALKLGAQRLPVTRAAVEQGLRHARLPGRFQRVPGEVEVVLDVAHNPHGVVTLVENLQRLPSTTTHAVFAVLDDKDAAGMASLLAPQVQAWYLSAVRSARALPADNLKAQVAPVLCSGSASVHASVTLAFRAARQAALPGDRIVVFGSFFTVAEVLSLGL